MGNWKTTLGNITRSITKTSGTLVKTTKLSISLSSEEGRLQQIYVDIGKKVHEIYAYGGSLGKAFDEKYKGIIEVEAKIAELRAQLDAAKDARTCRVCGQVTARSAEFCPKCGKAFEDGAPGMSYPVEPQMEEGNGTMRVSYPAVVNVELSEEPKKPCAVCGKENDASDRFCLYCGRML